MSELNNLNATGVRLDASAFDLPKNYSLLISRLEQLALGLDSAFAHLNLPTTTTTTTTGASAHDGGKYLSEENDNALNSLNRETADVAGAVELEQLLRATLTQQAATAATTAANTAAAAVAAAAAAGGGGPPPPPGGGPGSFYDQITSITSTGLHNLNDGEYTRVVNDIWIGVILTLLILCVVFFICSCFLYHKFQKWKNSYRNNPNEQLPADLCHHYPPEYESDALPSYTIVSGLPTYDDALEEFRKAGIILTPQILPPVVKLFEADRKDGQIFNYDQVLNDSSGGGGGGGGDQPGQADDNFSIHSTCTCGAGNQFSNSNTITSNSSASGLRAAVAAAMAANTMGPLGVGGPGGPAPQVIELSPEQLAALSQKRLSLQISFNSPVVGRRRNSRPRMDLYREVNRNNLLRSYASNAAAAAPAAPAAVNFPVLHRSSSSTSLASSHRSMQHRGSLF